MFLEQQIIILEWFLKDHVTLKTGVTMSNYAENSDVKIFPNFTVFTVFLSNKYSLVEHYRPQTFEWYVNTIKHEKCNILIRKKKSLISHIDFHTLHNISYNISKCAQICHDS